MTNETLHFFFATGSWWVIGVGSLLAIAVAWWTYRRTVPDLPQSWRLGLGGLRALGLMLLLLALFEPVMRFVRMTEHVGRPTVAAMRENTRTNLVSRPMQFLCWNMNYHAEHHYASSVPFHALPRLHEKLRGHIHVEPGGYLGAHREILAQILGRAPRADSPEVTGRG